MKSKKEVNYRQGDENGSCATCSFFTSPDKCSQVKGQVAGDGMCDIYMPLEQQPAAPAGMPGASPEQAIIDQLFGGGLPQ